MFRYWLMLFIACFAFSGDARAISPGYPSNPAHYFLTVWSYQGPDDDLVHAHTFVSFYAGSPSQNASRGTTISWLPASGNVQVFGAERGRNFSLGETLRMACQNGRRVQAWGPFEIRADLYRRGLQRIALLRSGRVQYSMLNGGAGAMNCIRAAADITPEPFESGLAWGETAGEAVVHHLSPYFIHGAASASGKPVRACSWAQ